MQNALTVLMREMGRKGGSVKSEAKAKSSRANLAKAHAARGDKISDATLRELLREANVTFHRRGYPDVTVIVDGDIAGFIEAKRQAEMLMPEQRAFKRLCEKYKIPFVEWVEGDPLPAWAKPPTGAAKLLEMADIEAEIDALLGNLELPLT